MKIRIKYNNMYDDIIIKDENINNLLKKINLRISLDEWHSEDTNFEMLGMKFVKKEITIEELKKVLENENKKILIAHMENINKTIYLKNYKNK